MTASLLERVTAVLTQHRASPFGGCECGWRPDGDAAYQPLPHLKHVAEQVVAELQHGGVS